MASLQWLLLCERAIVEDQAQTISLVSLLENIAIPAPPSPTAPDSQPFFLPVRFWIVQQWQRTNPKVGERVAVRVQLMGPDNKVFAAYEAVADLVTTPRQRLMSPVMGIPLVSQGIYKCVVQHKVRTKWRKAGIYEFGVSYQTPRRQAH